MSNYEQSEECGYDIYDVYSGKKPTQAWLAKRSQWEEADNEEQRKLLENRGLIPKQKQKVNTLVPLSSATSSCRAELELRRMPVDVPHSVQRQKVNVPVPSSHGISSSHAELEHRRMPVSLTRPNPQPPQSTYRAKEPSMRDIEQEVTGYSVSDLEKELYEIDLRMRAVRNVRMRTIAAEMEASQRTAHCAEPSYYPSHPSSEIYRPTIAGPVLSPVSQRAWNDHAHPSRFHTATGIAQMPDHVQNQPLAPQYVHNCHPHPSLTATQIAASVKTQPPAPQFIQPHPSRSEKATAKAKMPGLVEEQPRAPQFSNYCHPSHTATQIAASVHPVSQLTRSIQPHLSRAETAENAKPAVPEKMQPPAPDVAKMSTVPHPYNAFIAPTVACSWKPGDVPKIGSYGSMVVDIARAARNGRPLIDLDQIAEKSRRQKIANQSQ